MEDNLLKFTCYSCGENFNIAYENKELFLEKIHEYNAKLLQTFDDSLTSLPDSFTWVLIEDDGVGFSEPKTSLHSGEHVGLSIMADRAKRFGGSLNIESEPGEGTRIVLEFDSNNLTEKANNELEFTRTHHWWSHPLSWWPSRLTGTT